MIQHRTITHKHRHRTTAFTANTPGHRTDQDQHLMHHNDGNKAAIGNVTAIGG